MGWMHAVHLFCVFLCGRGGRVRGGRWAAPCVRCTACAAAVVRGLWSTAASKKSRLGGLEAQLGVTTSHVACLGVGGLWAFHRELLFTARAFTLLADCSNQPHTRKSARMDVAPPRMRP